MTLPAAVRAERQQELVELLEERDRLVAKLHEETKESKEEIKNLDRRTHEIRDILAGRTGEQQEIPGTGGVRLKERPGPEKRKRDPGPMMRRSIGDSPRVPLFVIEMTGLQTSKRLAERYGAGASFERGKPAPRLSEEAGRGR